MNENFESVSYSDTPNVVEENNEKIGENNIEIVEPENGNEIFAEEEPNDKVSGVEVYEVVLSTVEEDSIIPVFTIDDLLEKLGFGLFHVYLTLYTGSYFMMEAAEVIMLSLLLPFLKVKMDLSTFQESLIGAIVFTGMGIGSYFWGFVSDKKGRRFAILFSVVVSVIFGVLSAFCLNYYLFMIMRFMVGFAAGGAPVPFSLYTEYLPKSLRGYLVLCINFFWTIGAVYESLLGWIILTNDDFLNGYAWNWYVLCSSFPLIINLLLLPFTPESIRYLSMTKTSSEDDLKKIISMIERVNCRPKKIPKNYKIIMKSDSSKRRGKISDLFLRKTCFMFICICIFFMTGSFLYYGVALSTPDLIASSSESSSNTRFLGTLLLSLSEVVGLVAPSVLFLCFSRNFTQGIFFVLTGLSLLMLLIPVEEFSYKLMFGLGARIGVMASSCIMWVLSVESLPTNVRSVGSGIGNGLGKLSTVVAPFASFLFSEDEHFVIPKLVFSAVAFFAAIFSFVYPYESRGKGLADLGEEVELKDMNFLKKRNSMTMKKEDQVEDKQEELEEETVVLGNDDEISRSL